MFAYCTHPLHGQVMHECMSACMSLSRSLYRLLQEAAGKKPTDSELFKVRSIMSPQCLGLCDALQLPPTSSTLPGIQQSALPGRREEGPRQGGP